MLQFLRTRTVPERLNLQSLHRTISQMGRADMTHSLSRWKRSFPQNSRTTGLSIIWIKETWSHAHIPFRITTIRMGMAKWSMVSYCSLTISHCWKARPPRRPDLQRPHNNAKSPAWIVCLTLHAGVIFLMHYIQFTVLLAKRRKQINSIRFGMDSGVSHMRKKTVIPAVSLFFPACVLSFAYPQSSKKAYQSPFLQK